MAHEISKNGLQNRKRLSFAHGPSAQASGDLMQAMAREATRKLMGGLPVSKRRSASASSGTAEQRGSKSKTASKRRVRKSASRKSAKRMPSKKAAKN